jgi:hypothetical protein
MRQHGAPPCGAHCHKNSPKRSFEDAFDSAVSQWRGVVQTLQQKKPVGSARPLTHDGRVNDAEGGGVSASSRQGCTSTIYFQCASSAEVQESVRRKIQHRWHASRSLHDGCCVRDMANQVDDAGTCVHVMFSVRVNGKEAWKDALLIPSGDSSQARGWHEEVGNSQSEPGPSGKGKYSVGGSSGMHPGDEASDAVQWMDDEMSNVATRVVYAGCSSLACTHLTIPVDAFKPAICAVSEGFRDEDACNGGGSPVSGHHQFAHSTDEKRSRKTCHRHVLFRKDKKHGVASSSSSSISIGRSSSSSISSGRADASAAHDIGNGCSNDVPGHEDGEETVTWSVHHENPVETDEIGRVLNATGMKLIRNPADKFRKVGILPQQQCANVVVDDDDNCDESAAHRGKSTFLSLLEYGIPGLMLPLKQFGYTPSDVPYYLCNVPIHCILHDAKDPKKHVDMADRTVPSRQAWSRPRLNNICGAAVLQNCGFSHLLGRNFSFRDQPTPKEASGKELRLMTVYGTSVVTQDYNTLTCRFQVTAPVCFGVCVCMLLCMNACTHAYLHPPPPHTHTHTHATPGHLMLLAAGGD